MYQLKNIMELMVYSYLDHVLEDIDMCKCEKCKLDVAAIALNNLPTRYIVTDKGEMYSKIELQRVQYQVDVTGAIANAALIVSKNKRHE